MKDISGRFRKTLILTFLICILLSFLSYIFIYLFSVSDRRDSVQEEQGSVVVSSQAEDIPSSDEDEISYENESPDRTAQDLPVDESSSLSRSDVSQSADRGDAQSDRKISHRTACLHLRTSPFRSRRPYFMLLHMRRMLS